MNNKTAFALLLTAVFLVPLIEGHAHCSLVWTWETNCSYVKTTLLNQIAKWTNNECETGEKCGYSLSSNTTSEIKAVHKTPVKHYKDDLTMTFTDQSETCSVKGYSTSELWYAILDYGTNYCNLHNLVTGAGLDNKYNFVEKVSDDGCTQYSSADCNKY